MFNKVFDKENIYLSSYDSEFKLKKFVWYKSWSCKIDILCDNFGNLNFTRFLSLILSSLNAQNIKLKSKFPSEKSCSPRFESQISKSLMCNLSVQWDVLFRTWTDLLKVDSQIKSKFADFKKIVHFSCRITLSF